MSEQQLVLQIMTIVFSVAAIIGVIYGILAYIFQAIGMYSISKRRKLGTSGFAWVPILSLFKFGQIADDAILHKSGTKTRYMVLYPVFYLIGFILMNVSTLLVLVPNLTPGLISALQKGDIEMLGRILEHIVYSPTFVIAVILGVIGYVLVIISAVFQYICFYHIYKSCSRKWVSLFVLTFIFSVVYPFFLFAIRKQDNPDWYHSTENYSGQMQVE